MFIGRSRFILMALWNSMAVLPNVELREPIEARRAAFVPVTDPRVQEINDAYPLHRSFLGRFTDAFGVQLRPTVLLVRPNASRRFMTVDALASFRDVLSMSVIPRARARSIEREHLRGIHFSRAFDFYPWMIDKNYEYLIAITPAMMALHDVRKFNGQAAPEIDCKTMPISDLDQPMFDELSKRWRRCYSSKKLAWEDVALMRSLNMAFQASQLPASLDATILDYGRLVALWVSAFEILVHPGPGGFASQWAVYTLLEKAPWIRRDIRKRNLKCRARKKGDFERRPLPIWLYQRLNDARNDFLHGNPITKRRLLLPGTNRNLMDFAAPLYRMALTSFLSLRWKGEIPPMEDKKAFAQAHSDRWHFERYQREAEYAISASRGSERSHTAARKGIAAEQRS